MEVSAMEVARITLSTPSGAGISACLWARSGTDACSRWMASLEPSAEWSTCEAPPARHPAVSSSSARTSRISSRPGKKTSTAPLPVRESDALAPCSWRARPAVPICAMRLTTAAAKRQSALSVSAALDVDAPVGAPLSAGADCEHGSVSVPHANPPASTYPESFKPAPWIVSCGGAAGSCAPSSELCTSRANLRMTASRGVENPPSA
mmetsp:Transcript_31494/g.96328  ORF Transcript_31494/g.96328 Transcript_31494/m.96328 type:complete len:207 (+) Transcript_31494:1891-2511(+)